MAVRTTTASGGFYDVGTSYVGGVAPVAGSDSVTIASNATLTVRNSPTNHGLNGASNSIDLTINSGGNLVVQAGVTFNCRGSVIGTNGTITLEAGSTFNFDHSVAT